MLTLGSNDVLIRYYVLDARPFQCDQCAMAFARRHDLQRHMRSTHQKHKAFVCEHCGLVSGIFFVFTLCGP